MLAEAEAEAAAQLAAEEQERCGAEGVALLACAPHRLTHIARPPGKSERRRNGGGRREKGRFGTASVQRLTTASTCCCTTE